MPFERQGGARAGVCRVGLSRAGACDGRPDATRRRRLGSSPPPPARGREASANRALGLLTGKSHMPQVICCTYGEPNRHQCRAFHPCTASPRALWRLPRSCANLAELVCFYASSKSSGVTKASDIASDSAEDPAWLSPSLGRDSIPLWHLVARADRDLLRPRRRWLLSSSNLRAPPSTLKVLTAAWDSRRHTYYAAK